MASALVPTSMRKSIPTAAIDNKKEIIIPVDFSFRGISEFSEIESEEPRNPKDRPVTKDDSGKYHTVCARFNNNCIRDMKGIESILPRLFINPAAITWLDLSNNEIRSIDASICCFGELRILNLHGNQIFNVVDVENLEDLPKLFKLSLHGNPIEMTKNYRCYVISRLPQLKELDFSSITKADKATSDTWRKTNPPMKAKKRVKKEQ